MMKPLLIAVALLLTGDFALNHGNETIALFHGVRGFLEWLTQAGSDSIFTQ